LPRSFVAMLSLVLFLLPGCAGYGNLLPNSDRGAGRISGFDLGAMPVMMTLHQEVGELFAQPLLVLSRRHDGTVQIQNSAGPSNPDNRPFRAPLLALYSCPIQAVLPPLFQR
jgi:hypothetical protein